MRNAANEAMDNLLPEVVSLKHIIVSSADLFLSLCKNLAWYTLTWRTSKNHRTVKIGGAPFSRYGRLPMKTLCMSEVLMLNKVASQLSGLGN